MSRIRCDCYRGCPACGDVGAPRRAREASWHAADDVACSPGFTDDQDEQEECLPGCDMCDPDYADFVESIEALSVPFEFVARFRD